MYLHSILPAECIYGFLKIIMLKNDYFAKTHQEIIIKCFVDELRTTKDSSDISKAFKSVSTDHITTDDPVCC
jgi:hypothetical protein